MLDDVNLFRRLSESSFASFESSITSPAKTMSAGRGPVTIFIHASAEDRIT
jgi:hypothetical protein